MPAAGDKRDEEEASSCKEGRLKKQEEKLWLGKEEVCKLTLGLAAEIQCVFQVKGLAKVKS